MKSVTRNAGRFASLYLSLLRDLFRFRPGWTAGIIVFQILGPVLAPLIVVVLSQGVRLIQGRELPAGGLPERLLGGLEPVAVLALLSGAIVFLGLAGAVLAWLGASGARKLGRHYRLHLAETVLNHIANAPVGSIRLPARFAGEGPLLQATVTHGLKLNLAIISLFTALRHGTAAVALSLCLVYVDPFLSAVFFGAVCLILPLYYVLHQRTHRASRSWVIEGGARDTAKGLMVVGKEANALPEGPESGAKRRDLSEAIRENSAIIDNLETMEFGRLSGARSQLYGHAFRALFLGGALYLFGLAALKPGQLTWDSLIVFLVAASMLQVAVTSLFNSFSMLVWHGPPAAMILDYSRAVLRGGGPARKRRRAREAKAGASPGEIKTILLVAPCEIGRTSFAMLVEQLGASGVLEKGAGEIDFQAPRLRGMPLPKWREVVPTFAPGPDLTLMELGFQRKPEKAEIVASAGFRKVVMRVDCWEGPLEMFDYILKIDEKNRAEGGPPEYWKGRADLATPPKSSGAELDLELE